MAKITSLVNELASSFTAELPNTPPISFQTGSGFHWNHVNRCITYNPLDSDAPQFLMHELGHAMLHHTNFARSIELLEMERGAWEWAQAMGPSYGVSIDHSVADRALDTYRDWLHARSLCPRCSATGIESGKASYLCLACHHSWRVNEARTCALRRHGISK